MPEPELSAEAAKVVERTLAADHRFWLEVINGEVERLRFNQGFEPIRIDLYPASQDFDGEISRTGSVAFLGETQIGHVKFQAAAQWDSDAAGRKVLRLSILKAK
jgi:hypothetical protein